MNMKKQKIILHTECELFTNQVNVQVRVSAIGENHGQLALDFFSLKKLSDMQGFPNIDAFIAENAKKPTRVITLNVSSLSDSIFAERLISLTDHLRGRFLDGFGIWYLTCKNLAVSRTLKDGNPFGFKGISYIPFKDKIIKYKVSIGIEGYFRYKIQSKKRAHELFLDLLKTGQ